MLLRGCSPQKRWDILGEFSFAEAKDHGVATNIINTIYHKEHLDAAVEKLTSFSLVRRNNDYVEQESISLYSLVQYCALQRLSQREQNRWRLQAIRLVCHAFPRDQYIEDRFAFEIFHDLSKGLTNAVTAI